MGSEFSLRKRFVSSSLRPHAPVPRTPEAGREEPMNELEQVSESLVIRSHGYQPSPPAGEWRETPLMSGLDRLFREIGRYLEFVSIARGH